jgi:hypothetical protein
MLQIIGSSLQYCLYDYATWSLLWRACKLTSFSPCLTGPVDYPGSKPLAGLMWNRDSPVSVVSLHWWPWRDWSILWPRLRQASPRTITRPSCRQCDNPTWSHTALLSRFQTRCRSPFRLHNRQSWLLGGSPVENLQSHFILIMSHWSSGLPICFPSEGPGFKNPWGDLCETGILLLALSCYTTLTH